MEMPSFVMTESTTVRAAISELKMEIERKKFLLDALERCIAVHPDGRPCTVFVEKTPLQPLPRYTGGTVYKL